MPVKVVSIDPDIATLMVDGKWLGNQFWIPKQLEPPIYKRLDRVLRALGGKWDRSEGAHVFPADGRDRMNEALANSEVIDRKKTLEQFFTPGPIARKVWAAARLQPKLRILEPSAGDGALLGEPMRLGCNILAVELDQMLADSLDATSFTYRGPMYVIRGDFLDLTADGFDGGEEMFFDRVIMNPPFANNADVRHVMRAWQFLRPGGRLVAITSAHWTFGKEAICAEFREFVAENGSSEEIPAGAFTSSGTNIHTVLVTLDKIPPDPA